MAAPTSLTVTVDNTEYSRYEIELDTISVNVIAEGGPPYSDTPVKVELVKARRSRDAVVATENITITSNADPATESASFYLPDLVDQDMIHLVRNGKYFVKATYEATKAVASIGAGANGTINLVAPAGADGNDYTIEVVIPTGTSDLAVSVVGTAITVNLSVSSDSLVSANNTALNVASAIGAALTDFTVTYTGDGSTSLTSEEGPTSFSGGTDEVTGESSDFDIRVVTVARLKRDWLFGIDLKSTKILKPKFPLTDITGIQISEISTDHPKGVYSLNYSFKRTYVNATASIGSGADGTVTIEADDDLQGLTGNSYTVSTIVPTGTSSLSASLVGNNLQISLATVAGVPEVGSNTATLIAAAVNLVDNFTATASGTGASEITSATSKSFTNGATNTVRLMSWNGGPSVQINSTKSYALKSGVGNNPAAKLLSFNNNNQNYIVVKVNSLSAMPTSNVVEDVLLDYQEIDDNTLGRYLNEAVALVESGLLNVYVEPTVVSTERDSSVVQYVNNSGAVVPIYVDSDYDFIKMPLTHFLHNSGGWVHIRPPFYSILRVDSLFGAIANTRVIDIDLEWVEVSEKGGFMQLVPFNQEIAFNYIGLVWINAIHGARELPNFWHYNMVVGLRACPSEVQELIGKIAAVNALTAASLAYRPGVGSMSLSRDGVSQSVSYNTQAQYGVYTATIQSYKDWIEEHQNMLRSQYMGSRMVVV